MMKLSFSLKQLWSLIVLFSALTPTVIALFWYGTINYKAQLEYELATKKNANIAIRNEIEFEVRRFKTLIRNKSDPLSFIVKSNKTSNNITQVNSLLAAIVNREPAIHEAMLLSLDAKVIADIDPGNNILGDRPLSKKDLSDISARAGFKGKEMPPEVIIPSSGQIYVGSPKTHDNKLVFTMATAIGVPIQAVLVIFVDVDKLWVIDESERDAPFAGIQSYMLDRRGMLLTQISDSKFKPGDLLTHQAIFRTALLNGKWETDQQYTGIIGKEVFGTQTTIPSLNWTLISEIGAAEITDPIFASLFKVTFIAIGLIIAFILAVLYLANKTLQPIQRASDAIDLIAKGNYQISLNPTGIRELDAMSLGIERMTMARKRVEHELIDKEKEQRQMLNSMVDAVISIDEDGTILSFNTAAESLFGYSQDEIIGINVDQLMPEPYSSKHSGYLQRYLTTGEAHIIGFNRDVDVAGLHKDGSTFPLRLLIAELPKGSNGKRRFIGSCVDLTDTKQQQEQLRRSQKMDALGKLTGGIAHDYNNMLGIIMGYARMLERALPENEKLARYANEIHHAGERGAKLTRKLLNFSSKDSSDNTVLNINDALHDTKNMLQKTLTARINLVYNLSDNLWPVSVDNSEFEDAILNMSINAMHAIHGNGRITIKTRNESIQSIDTKSMSLTPGEYVVLSITDTGAGMDEATRDKIFEPFYTTKGDEGTGLGLSQVYGFMQRSNGAIKVYSEPDHGTRFTLYFPRQHNEISSDASQGEDNSAIAGGTETILLVDDEAALLALNFELLKQQGYQVFCANNGLQALEILETKHVDLLLTDVIMPEMDGYQLAEAVHKKYPDIKIQLASGFHDKQNSELIDNSLIINLLTKPFKARVLFNRLRELLDE